VNNVAVRHIRHSSLNLNKASRDSDRKSYRRQNLTWLREFKGKKVFVAPNSEIPLHLRCHFMPLNIRLLRLFYRDHDQRIPKRRISRDENWAYSVPFSAFQYAFYCKR
jgi:hypothetical protein